MIYLCSLYSNGIHGLPEQQVKEVVEKRVDYTMRRVKGLLLREGCVFSPILHCHEMAKRYDLPKEYDFWKRIDRAFIDCCSEVMVLTMKDEAGSWKESVGVQDEIAYATSLGKPVHYLKCDDYV